MSDTSNLANPAVLALKAPLPHADIHHIPLVSANWQPFDVFWLKERAAYKIPLIPYPNTAFMPQITWYMEKQEKEKHFLITWEW